MSTGPSLKKRPAIAESFLLLAEGTSDAAFFRALLSAEAISGVLVENPEEETERAPGLEGYPDYLNGLITRSRVSLRGLIITRDCDDSSDDAFNNIADTLRAAGYTAPAKPLEIVPSATSSDGHTLPAIAVILIPWVGGVGCLETLLLPSACAKWSKFVPCVDEWCKCLEAGKWDISRQSKVRMRALLSAANPRNPSLSLARIWKKKATRLPLNDPCFKPIAEFSRHFCASV